MKLYLSSQRLGNHSNKILELVGENKNVVVIANALDDKSQKHRDDRVNKEKIMLKSIGLNPEELDLRNFFGKGRELGEYIKSKSLIWIRGGNVFILRRAMMACEFDKYVLPLIKQGKIAFGGYSAGTIIACRDLFASEMVDDIYSVPDDYPVDFLETKGLNLLNFYLIPHWDSTEDWAKNIKSYGAYLKSKNRKVVTICDGEVYYSNNDIPVILK